MEKDCNELGTLFQEAISDIKASFSLWDDFTNKAIKLNSALKLTVIASAAFNESFFKLSDMANGTRGATKDIGSVLTKLCLRHQAVEDKLKIYAASLMDLLVVPVQKSLDDWQKIVAQLDKDHARDYKKANNDLKKASSETVRLQKKVNKGKTDLQSQLDEASKNVHDKYVALEESEKQAVSCALTEERNHLCLFASCLKPVLDNEIAVLNEVERVQEIADTLLILSANANSLSATAEQVLMDAMQGIHPPQRTQTENKKKLSKEDISIEVVTGSFQTYSDTSQRHMMEIPSSSSSIAVAASSFPLPPTDRPHTISTVYYQGHPRPMLASDTYGLVQSLIPEGYEGSADPFPSAARKESDRINESSIKRSKSIQSAGSACVKKSANIMERNGALLQVPYESCQSLQCSSGYGTMSNVSTGSIEAVGSTGDFEMVVNALYDSCDIPKSNKYCTLPNKRQNLNRSTNNTLNVYEMLPEGEGTMMEAGIGHFQLRQLTHSDQTKGIYQWTTGNHGNLSTVTHRRASMESEPLPPLLPQQNFYVDSDDDLPPPPPPEDLFFPTDGEGLGQIPGNRKSHVPPVHMDVMQSLNAKLSARNSVKPRQVNNKYDTSLFHGAVSMAHQVNKSEGDDSELAKQLQTVRLRRMVSDDRSAPRIKKN